MTRLWPNGEVIRVTIGDSGDPAAFQWDGALHPVQGVANRWRVDDHWWDGRIWRDYFKLTTVTGWLVIVYRDLLTNTWYLQRLYD